MIFVILFNSGCLLWLHSLDRASSDLGPFWAVEKSRVAMKSKLHKHDFCHFLHRSPKLGECMSPYPRMTMGDSRFHQKFQPAATSQLPHTGFTRHAEIACPGRSRDVRNIMRAGHFFQLGCLVSAHSLTRADDRRQRSSEGSIVGSGDVPRYT